MIEQLTQDIISLIRTLPPASVYLVFFGIAYGENIIPPIPGDLLVAFSGYLAAESIIGIVPIWIITTIASVFGFMSMYWIGSRWGTTIKQEGKGVRVLRFIPVEYLNKVQSWMQKWGLGLVLANRFLPGTRSVISLAAGLGHTRINYTILFSTISSLLWNAILLGFGWVVHENWRMIGDYLSVYGRIILAATVLYIAIKVGIYYYRK